MMTRFLAAAVLGSALIAAPAFAQTATPPASTSTSGAQTASAAGLWQGSKLIGLNVYNQQNEKIGSIAQLMVNKDGRIDSVVIGVGGFLGMGERDVAVKFSDLKWSNEPVRSSTTSSSSSSTPPPSSARPAPTTTTGTATNSSNGPVTYPDHAVLNASRDQLKSMPQFDYNK